MRLFAALELPPPVAAALAGAVAAVRPALPAVLRTSAPERWHLTLAFYGEVAETRFAALAARLARAGARTPPIRLALAGAGRFGHAVLWCGVVGDPGGLGELAALARRAGAAGRRVGAGAPAPHYRPHVTVARARGPVDLTGAVRALTGFASPPWTATELVLVRSTLGVQVRHEVLGRYPLTGSSRSTT